MIYNYITSDVRLEYPLLMLLNSDLRNAKLQLNKPQNFCLVIGDFIVYKTGNINLVRD
jgi:hypothetical protein